MANKHMDKVNQAYFDIIKAGYLEDRREYDTQLLAASYPDFTCDEVDNLERLIQVNFTTKPNSDDLLEALGKELAGDMQMAIDDNDIGRNMGIDIFLRDYADVHNRLANAVTKHFGK